MITYAHSVKKAYLPPVYEKEKRHGVIQTYLRITRRACVTFAKASANSENAIQCVVKISIRIYYKHKFG